jgi:RNA polymerase sigma factor (sigma-70 family)
VTPEESVELVVQYQKAKLPARRKRLLDRLLRAHLPLIKRLVRKAATAEKSSEEIDDLVQAGCIAFVTAVEKFDASRQTTLSTYLAHWVRHEVQQATRSGRTVRLPRIRMTNDERKAALERVRANPEATPAELGLSATKVDQLKYSIGLRFASTSTEAGQRALERNDSSIDAGPDATRIDKRELLRRVWTACTGLSWDETRAVRIQLRIDKEPKPLRPIRSPQLYFPFRDRFRLRPHLERCALTAAQRIDAIE